MTFLELRAAIISLLNKADNLSAEEVYGVVSSVEAEVRLSILLKEQSAQPVAQPLTLEQLLGIVKKLGVTPDMSHVDVFKTFARAIESAHGIREVK